MCGQLDAVLGVSLVNDAEALYRAVDREFGEDGLPDAPPQLSKQLPSLLLLCGSHEDGAQ